MLCPKCGAQCSNDELTCPSCGAPLTEELPQSETPSPETVPEAAPETVPETAPTTEQDATEETAPEAVQESAPEADESAPQAEDEGKKRFKFSPNVKLIAAVVAAVVVVIALIAILGGKGGKSSYPSYADNGVISLYIDEEPHFYAGEKEVGSLDSYLEDREYSMDYSVVAASEYGGSLYAVTAKGMEKVADDVSVAYISSNGATILYIDQDSELYWYNVAKKSASKVKGFDEDCTLRSISPDGSAIAFVRDESDEYEGFTCLSGKDPVSIGSDKVPMAISDNGTYVYYVKLRDSSKYGALYAAKGNKENKLASDFSIRNDIILNQDGSQILYADDDKTYYSSKAGEKQKVLSSEVYYMLTPEYTSSVSYESCGSGNQIYAVANLLGQCYYSGGSIYYINSKGESDKIASNYDDIYLSADGSSVIYLKNGALRKISDLEKGKEIDLTDKVGITDFVAKADLSAVYYLDNDDELYYQKGTGKAVKVSDDVDDFFMAADGSVCYVINDDVLYTISGKSISPVKGLDDVQEYGDYGGALYFFQYVSKNTYDVYRATGSTPKLFISGFED